MPVNLSANRCSTCPAAGSSRSRSARIASSSPPPAASTPYSFWEAATGKRVGQALRHEGAINTLSFNPDGGFLLSASEDQTARLWHLSTGKPVGLPLRHAEPVIAATFAAADKGVFTLGLDGLRHWPVGRPITSDAERISLWTEVLTGLTLDGDDEMQTLDGKAWLQRYKRLDQLGGVP